MDENSKIIGNTFSCVITHFHLYLLTGPDAKSGAGEALPHGARAPMTVKAYFSFLKPNDRTERKRTSGMFANAQT